MAKARVVVLVTRATIWMMWRRACAEAAEADSGLPGFFSKAVKGNFLFVLLVGAVSTSRLQDSAGQVVGLRFEVVPRTHVV